MADTDFAADLAQVLTGKASADYREPGRFFANTFLTAFLTSLFKAVESSPNASLVYTLAIGKDGRVTDAYSAENQFVADQMAEIESVSARKATLLNPTEEDETVQVLRRRLFEHIDGDAAAEVVDAYRELWVGNRDALGPDAARPETIDQFRASYPLHPHVLETLTGKTATLANFQRVRGMLRLLAHTVKHLWRQRPADAMAIHLHHVDPGYEPIRQEIVTRLGQDAFVPAITNDVAAGSAEQRSLAEEIDAEQHQGLPPYAAYVARTIFMHTLAFNDPLKGLTAEELRYATAGPAVNPSFIDEARKRFTAESAYLDDRPAAPMQFRAEANLNVIIRREEQHVEAAEARAQLNDRIRGIFGGKTFETVAFPGGPFDVPDEVGEGRPKLAVFAYDGLAIGDVVDEVPDLVERVYARSGAEGSGLRRLRNHLVFVAADEHASDAMRRRMRSRLALQRLKAPNRLVDLAEHQQEKIRDLEARSEQELAIAVQACYRHVFYPSRNRIGTRGVDLAHTAIDIPSASNQPGAGQQQVARALRDLKKLRFPEDEPDAPTYVRDRTPLRKGQMTTAALRDEFRRDPALPMLLGDDIFIRGIRLGIEQGDYVYQRGDLLFGHGDPPADIRIDEQAVVMTMAYAKDKGVWPRSTPLPPVDPPPPPDPPPVDPPPPPDPPDLPPSAVTVSAEGVLRDALTQLWEQARARRAARVGVLTVRMFEASDAFRLLGAVGAVSGAEKVVTITGGYETRDGSTFEMEFRGSVPDAQPVRESPGAAASGCRVQEGRGEVRVVVRRGLATGGRCARDAYGTPVPLREWRRLRLGDRGGEDLMARVDNLASVATPASAPRYALRVRAHGASDTEYEIWQLPAPATPHVRAPIRIAGLRGRNLDLIEHRVLRRLAGVGVRPGPSAGRGGHGYALAEDTALTLGLLFRALAPMRSRDNMRAVAEGIEKMEREEAAYWLGMAMHRRHPRRVLTALRVLLTGPRRDGGR